MLNYIQPAVGQSVTVPVPAHRFIPNLVVFHQYGGYYRVTGTSQTTLTLTNLGWTSPLSPPLGFSNPPSGSQIQHDGARIVLAGEPGNTGNQGPQGQPGQQGYQGEEGEAGPRGFAGYSMGRPKGSCQSLKCTVDAQNLGIPVCHADHGYKAGDVLRVSPDYVTEFELATAATLATSYAIGIVQCVIDKNMYIMVTGGRIEFADEENGIGLPVWAPDGLMPGAVYFLSDTPGELSLFPGTVERPMLVGYEERTGFLLNASSNSTGGGEGGDPGMNAFTTTTANFQVPNVDGFVNVPVANALFMAQGQIIYIKDAGYFQVASITAPTLVLIKNVGQATAIPGTTIAGSNPVVPAGVRGYTGPIGPAGVEGAQGTQGPQGGKGDKGDKGDQGNQGIQGIQGTQGIQGIQGQQGEQGEQGVPGPTGPQGLAGGSGFNAVVELVNNKTYTLCQYAPVNETLTYIVIKSAAGTCTAKFQVNGADIAGADAIAVTSTEQSVAINQAIAIGDTVTMIISTNSLAVDLAVVMGA